MLRGISAAPPGGGGPRSARRSDENFMPAFRLPLSANEVCHSPRPVRRVCDPCPCETDKSRPAEPAHVGWDWRYFGQRPRLPAVSLNVALAPCLLQLADADRCLIYVARMRYILSGIPIRWNDGSGLCSLDPDPLDVEVLLHLLNAGFATVTAHFVAAE